MKYTIFLIISVFTLSNCAFFVPEHVEIVVQKKPQTFVIFEGGLSVAADTVTSPSKKALGLGGRTHLPENSGMLFIYDEPADHQFWMKGMLMPIDIIWLDEGKVVDITHEIPPPNEGDDELPTYSPSRPASLILEVNAGYARNAGIEVGDTYTVKEIE